MSKLLVAVADYPDNQGKVSMMYVHTRNRYYKQHNIEVVVLNFSASEDYIYDTIPVITYATFCKSQSRYDLLVLHAANVRYHYKFIKKYGDVFPAYLFFFHGHEVLRINDAYSKPYYFKKKNIAKAIIQDLYDTYKLMVWRRFFLSDDKSELIFVSKWMQEKFLQYTKISFDRIKDKSHITYNNVGSEFEMGQFDDTVNKEFDFVTIRSNLDDSKYAIDIVNNSAKRNINMRFLLIGKGTFFNHETISPNITWIDKTLDHNSICRYLQKSRFALMPTRTDAQGLMMCEMAAFGIPVITSNIPVCHEVFDGFENAYYIDNNREGVDLSEFYNMPSKSVKDVRYYQASTVSKEVKLINDIITGKEG